MKGEATLFSQLQHIIEINGDVLAELRFETLANVFKMGFELTSSMTEGCSLPCPRSESN